MFNDKMLKAQGWVAKANAFKTKGKKTEVKKKNLTKLSYLISTCHT